MKALLVAATLAELESTLKYFSFNRGKNPIPSGEIHVLITGVGMVATAFAMGSAIAVLDFDIAINAGIAGSFDRNLSLGEVVQVQEDCLAELGAEENESFIPFSALGFGENTLKPIHPLIKTPPLKPVKAITVNTVHGNEISIEKVRQQWQPQIESMEGAAFFYACQQKQLSSVQIRAISNYVEKRNRTNWEIDLAIKNLNKVLIDCIKDWL